MHQQRNAHFLHEGHGALRILHGPYASFAVRGCSRRVQLDAEYQFLERSQFLFGIGAEERRHVRLEDVSPASVQHPLPVGLHRIRIRHRGHQVGHDDRPGKGGGAQGCDQFQHVAVPQVKMHVQRGVQFQNHAGIMGEDCGEIKHGPLLRGKEGFGGEKEKGE